MFNGLSQALFISLVVFANNRSVCGARADVHTVSTYPSCLPCEARAHPSPTRVIIPLVVFGNNRMISIDLYDGGMGLFKFEYDFLGNHKEGDVCEALSSDAYTNYQTDCEDALVAKCKTAQASPRATLLQRSPRLAHSTAAQRTAAAVCGSAGLRQRGVHVCVCVCACVRACVRACVGVVVGPRWRWRWLW